MKKSSDKTPILPTQKSASNAIEKTKKWILESVIHYQFCPYAKQPFQDNRIGYQINEGDDILLLLEKLACCCLALDGVIDNGAEESLETTLLIVANPTNYLDDFYDYLDALDVANDFLEKPQQFIQHFSDSFQFQYAKLIPVTWAGKYQLASFHPNYQFEGSTVDDRENYTNRSPYPTFHIIRNASIEYIRINDKQAETIVARNIETLENLSADAFQLLKNLAHQNHH